MNARRFRSRVALALPSVWVLALVLGLSLAQADGRPSPFDARVTRVVDGDTVEVESEQGKDRIRLAQIDAPESKQPHGRTATQALADLIDGRTVRVVPVTRDRYGRLVAELYLGSLHVNAQLISDGHSWVYRRYAVDRSLDRLEDQARSGRRGLWALPESERLPPWAWRASRRKGRSEPTRHADETLPARCREKHTCREMTSCSEAMFFLKECRMLRLDGDRDGVPCESLCSRLAGEDEG